MTVERAVVPMEDPQAALERAFIEEYLKTRGQTLRSLHDLPEDQVTALLRSASLYAAIKLAEVEARATYVHEIHGASSE
jgi:phosphoserine aminotransferase